MRSISKWKSGNADYFAFPGLRAGTEFQNCTAGNTQQTGRGNRTGQTVNNSVECFTIKESGSSLVYCSDTLKSKIQMEIIKGHYTVETKEVFAIVSNPKHSAEAES